MGRPDGDETAACPTQQAHRDAAVGDAPTAAAGRLLPGRAQTLRGGNGDHPRAAHRALGPAEGRAASSDGHDEPPGRASPAELALLGRRDSGDALAASEISRSLRRPPTAAPGMCEGGLRRRAGGWEARCAALEVVRASRR